MQLTKRDNASQRSPLNISDNNKIINNRYDCRCDKYYTHSDFTIATLFIKKEKV